MPLYPTTAKDKEETVKPFNPKLIKYSKSTKKYVTLTGITGLVTSLTINTQSKLIAKII